MISASMTRSSSADWLTEVDITAHRQALQSGLRTIAILGSGINNIYPSQYLSVARSMTEKGAIISEHYHDKGPDRENFPMRNRIIAGLSDAIIMVDKRQDRWLDDHHQTRQ